MKYEKLSKKAMGCMLVAELIGMLFWLLVGGGVLFFVDEMPQIVKTLIIIVMALIVIGTFISPKVRYERYRYCITEEELDIKEGFLWVERNIVPIERLHKIAVERGPIDRMFGLSKVKVTTAGGEVTLRFLEDEKADFIADSLKKKINEKAREERKYRQENLEVGE